MSYQNPNRNPYYASTIGGMGGAPKGVRRSPGMLGGLAAVHKAIRSMSRNAPVPKHLSRGINKTFKHIPHQILSDSVPVHHTSTSVHPRGIHPNNTKPPPHHGKSTGQGGHGHPMDTGGAAQTSTPILGNYSGYMTNPASYARAATDMQYGPVIADLLRQQTRQKAEQGQNIADIGSWFQGVGKVAAQNTASDVAAGQAASNEYQSAARGLAAAFGGTADPSNPVAGMAAQLGAASIAAGSNNQASYDRQLESIFKAQGAQAQTNETRYQHNLADKLAAQLMDTRSARGSAYTKNLADASQQRLQQMAAIQNMQIAQAMLPGQLQGQQLDLANKALGIQSQKIGLKSLNHDLRMKLRTQAADGLFASIGINDGAGRDNLITAVNENLHDASGGASASPTDAWAKAGGYLTGLGLQAPKNNKKLAAWLKTAWLPYVREYNAAHKDHPFTPKQMKAFLKKAHAS